MTPRSAWIIDARTDLVWFIGSAFLAVAFLAALLATPYPETLWIAWAALVDTPHYFGTYSRTYLDDEARRRLGRPLRASLLFLVVGPVAISASALLFALGVSPYRAPLVAFTLAFNAWAYWHLVRQHHGLAGLYRRRAGEGELDRRLDTWLVHGTLIAAFALLVLGHPESRATFGLGPRTARFGAAGWPPAEVGVVVAWGVIAVLVSLFVARQVQRARAGHPVPWPKIAFLASVVSTYLFVSTYEPGYRLPLFVWTGTITIGHNFQYQALVWFHHRNRQGVVRSARPRFWLRSFGRYLLAATAVGLGLRTLGFGLGVFPGVPPLLDSANVPLFGDVALRELLFSVMLGVAMHHYYLDQIIWRPGRDPALRRDLGLPA